LSGRGNRTYYRKDNGTAISEEDIYTMLMMFQYQHKSIGYIARKYAVTDLQVRILLGKRSGGSCCG